MARDPVVPELPEVETVVRGLRNERLVGRSLSAFEVCDSTLFKDTQALRNLNALRSSALRKVGRRGKYLLLRFSSGWTLVLHLGMSGKILEGSATVRKESASLKHERLRLYFRGGPSLHLVDPRRFGKAWCVANADSLLKKLGPEPLDISWRQFANRIGKHRRQIKPLLMEQSVIAGVGNIYADEALWRAQIHPLRCASTLSAHELHTLWRSLRDVLRCAIQKQGTSLGVGEGNFVTPSRKRGAFATYLRVYGRTGQPCLRCRALIRRTQIAQRSAHWCPRCQPLPARTHSG